MIRFGRTFCKLCTRYNNKLPNLKKTSTINVTSTTVTLPTINNRKITVETKMGVKGKLPSPRPRTTGGRNTNKPTTSTPNVGHTESVFKANLDEYFNTTKFQMNKALIPVLRHYMERVYLREQPLFCFDVEAWEGNNNLVTEIGIAVYDPKGQENAIFPNISLYHIIIDENKSKYNGRFVPNNKNNFVGGTSHVLPEGEAKVFLNKMIRQYFFEDPRGAVFVGHHIGGDIKWLQSIGVEFPKDGGIVDTLKIYNLSHGKNGGGLRSVLRLMDIPHAYLHNAANDAYYTLLAALVWCDPAARRAKKIDSHVVPPAIYPTPQKLRGEAEAAKRLKRQEKFTDTARKVTIQDGSILYKEHGE